VTCAKLRAYPNRCNALKNLRQKDGAAHAGEARGDSFIEPAIYRQRLNHRREDFSVARVAEGTLRHSL
jgi:hypothetical protein